MFTLRCTRKLLGRLGSLPVANDSKPTTKLGDWYANLLYHRGGQVVLFVNERTLLPVLVEASPAGTLVSWFVDSAADLLLQLGVLAATVETGR